MKLKGRAYLLAVIAVCALGGCNGDSAAVANPETVPVIETTGDASIKESDPEELSAETADAGSLLERHTGPFPELYQPDCSAYLIIEDAFDIIESSSEYRSVIVGRINQGSLKVGDKVSILDHEGNFKFADTIVAMEYFREVIDTASEGMNVGIAVKAHSKQDFDYFDYLVVDYQDGRAPGGY